MLEKNLLLTLLTRRTKKTQSMLTLALLLEVLKKSYRKKVESELCILFFKNDCIRFLSAIVIKLLEKSLLEYSGSEFGDGRTTEVGI